MVMSAQQPPEPLFRFEHVAVERDRSVILSDVDASIPCVGITAVVRPGQGSRLCCGCATAWRCQRAVAFGSAATTWRPWTRFGCAAV
jgi:hypothetical protein